MTSNLPSTEYFENCFFDLQSIKTELLLLGIDFTEENITDVIDVVTDLTRSIKLRFYEEKKEIDELNRVYLLASNMETLAMKLRENARLITQEDINSLYVIAEHITEIISVAVKKMVVDND